MNTSSAANVVLIAGIPIAVSLCGWGLTEIIQNGKTLERVATSIEAMQREINGHDNRIDRLENQYFGR